MNIENSTTLSISKCHEVQIHYKRPLIKNMAKVSSSREVCKLLKEHINLNQLDYKEFFWVMVLSNANHVLGISQISVGSTRGTMVNIKEVYQLGLLMNASGLIVAHNHPSGILRASQSDIELTKKLSEGAKLLDLKLLDHLILTSESYMSFSDEGIF